MVYFLTSSPCVEGACRFHNLNGFFDQLWEAVAHPCRCVYIASSPDDPEKNERYSGEMRGCFEADGFEFTDYTLLDRRNAGEASELVAKADLLILSGGHVPTQNRFFRDIGLRELLEGYDGVVMGISAGTMNCADVVYAQPEEEGEAVDPGYERFLPGLGLTQTQVLPHYQMVKDDILDGLRLFEDITFADSMGHRFYALVDGSYLVGDRHWEELRGEAYVVENGEMYQISKENDVIVLSE